MMTIKQNVNDVCTTKFNRMDIWYILDNQEQLFKIRGILQCYNNGEILSPRQAVRLYDFYSSEANLYVVYSSEDIKKRYVEIKYKLYDKLEVL